MKKVLPPCKKSCKGYVVDSRRGQYCPCIEKKLPKSSRQSVKALYSGRIEEYWLREEFSRKARTVEAIERKLQRFGLSPYEVELIMLRYVDDMQMKEIVKEQGWVNASSAGYFLKKTLAKLRLGGFRL